MSIGPGMSSTPINIVVLTASAFLLPTSVLSSISPMVAKLKLESLEETGAVVGRLSAAGTVGALVGTFGTGFILLGLFPIRAIIFVIGMLLSVAGVLVLIKVAKEKPDGFQSSLVAIAAFLCLGIGNQCDVETDYACARVIPDEDRAGGRSLILDSVRHAHVDLDDPTHLEIRYAKLLGAVIDGMPAGPLDALHVGGGGFSIPRYLSTTRPDSTNVVLEIDEGLVDIARDELGLADAQNLDIRIGDARLEFEPLPTDGFDVIVGDAFGGDVVPWHLTTTEAVAQYDRLLRDDGIYVMNLIDGDQSRFARAQMATLYEHFDHVAVMLPVELPSVPYNQIIVASDAPLPSVTIPEGAGSLVADAAALAYVGDAQVLTDDFAPAEQLKQ